MPSAIVILRLTSSLRSAPALSKAQGQQRMPSTFVAEDWRLQELLAAE